jgi:hypothetical protein
MYLLLHEVEAKSFEDLQQCSIASLTSYLRGHGIEERFLEKSELVNAVEAVRLESTSDMQAKFLTFARQGVIPGALPNMPIPRSGPPRTFTPIPLPSEAPPSSGNRPSGTNSRISPLPRPQSTSPDSHAQRANTPTSNPEHHMRSSPQNHSRSPTNKGDYPTIAMLVDCKTDPSTLSNRALKGILSSNFVDHSHAIEKFELVEKVKLLMENQVSKESSLSPTDAVCRICMDEVADCVLLECGHVGTCRSCAIQLSECPFCRSRVIRVVRLFHA